MSICSIRFLLYSIAFGYMLKLAHGVPMDPHIQAPRPYQDLIPAAPKGPPAEQALSRTDIEAIKALPRTKGEYLVAVHAFTSKLPERYHYEFHHAVMRTGTLVKPLPLDLLDPSYYTHPCESGFSDLFHSSHWQGHDDSYTTSPYVIMDGPRTMLKDCSSTYDLDRNQDPAPLHRREPEAWIYLKSIPGQPPSPDSYQKVCIPIKNGVPYTVHVPGQMLYELNNHVTRGYCIQRAAERAHPCEARSYRGTKLGQNEMGYDTTVVPFGTCQQQQTAISFTPSANRKECILLRSGASNSKVDDAVTGTCVHKKNWPVLYNPSESAGRAFAAHISSHGAAPLPWSIASVKSDDPQWIVTEINSPADARPKQPPGIKRRFKNPQGYGPRKKKT